MQDIQVESNINEFHITKESTTDVYSHILLYKNMSLCYIVARQ